MIWWQKPRLCSSSNCSQWRGFCGAIIPHIKTNQRNEKKIHIFPLVFDPVGCLFKFNHYQYFYLWTQDKYVCWVSFFKAIICHFLLSVLCVLHTVFYSSFNYFFYFVLRGFSYDFVNMSVLNKYLHIPQILLGCF